MSNSLRVLIVDDDRADAELITRELQKGGFQVDWSRVEEEHEFIRSVQKQKPDIIISDHAMPRFSAGRALDVMRGLRLDIPFLVVSGAIGEEQAARLLRQGAADYLMKDRLGRLSEAVRLAIEQQDLRANHAAAQEAIVQLNADLERRIAERTAELQAANQSLQVELEGRKRAESQLEQLTRDLETRVHERTSELRASQQQLQALASELTLTEQRERRRLATDLHDYLAQLLVLMRMKMRQVAPLVRDTKATGLLIEVDQTITQSLDYTRSLVAELTPPTLKEFGLIEALNWLVEQMRRHDLAVSVKQDAETISLPDDQAVLLFQSVRELLLNVVKHSGTKQATVTVDAPHPTELRLTVEDAGAGFDPANMERKSRSGGFGLFSIRQRMEAMGGRLEVDSSPGRGARLSLLVPHWPQTEEVTGGRPSDTLRQEAKEQPVAEPQAETAPLTEVSPRVQKSQTVRVLLVDDHAMVRQGLRSILEGYPDLQVVGEASDGMTAVELADTLEPDVIVMDVSLPQLDGPEATRRIKQQRPDTTVIGLSINRTRQVKEAMTEAGALAYLTKESAVEQLHEVIIAAVGAKQEA